MKKLITIVLLVSVMACGAQTFFKDLNPGARPSRPGSFVSCNGNMFFLAYDTGDFYSELWVSDGTAAGTHMVKDIKANGGSIVPTSPLLVCGNFVYFIADDGVNSKQVWRSDGTASGTIKLSSSQAFEAPENLTVSNGWVFFSSFDLSYGRELWKTNGSVAGTQRAVDVEPGTADGIPKNTTGYPAMADVNGTLYFVGTDGFSGYEIYKTDGTSAGTSLVKNIMPGNNTSARPMNLFAFNNKLYFTFNAGTASGNELYESDGTAGGTTLMDLNSGSGNSSPDDFTVSQGKLFFTAYTSATGRELWATDGASAPSMVTEVEQGAKGITTLGVPELADGGGILYFYSDDGSEGSVWRSDGTSSGTYSLAGSLANNANNPYGFFSSSGYVFFAAETSSSPYGKKLYVIKSFNDFLTVLNSQDGAYSYQNPGSFGEFNGQIYFGAEEMSQGLGSELWTLDPTGLVSLGIAESKTQALHVFPNPTPGELIMVPAFAGSKVKVANALGQEVLESDIGVSGRIDVNVLSPGVYHLQLVTDKGIVSTRFVKQ